MKLETRRAALRMAAKVALVATTASCSGAPPRVEPSVQPTATEAAAKDTPETCTAYLDTLAMTDLGQPLPESDPLHGRNNVYGAFVDVAARSAPRTQDCCSGELDSDRGQSKHRWACCSALPAERQTIACSPWGPPVPPEMPAHLIA
ncbi:MAG TPA: hypothetical protein VGM90_35535 [Kofleriaceae bacterium]